MKRKFETNDFNPQTMKDMANAMLQLESQITRLRAEAQRLAERCRLLEKHIWYDVYRIAKESGKLDDDAEVFANEAIELLNYAINEEISGEGG